MKKTVTIYKKVGETPLQTVLRFKKSHPQYLHDKVSYAGRLDPMAHGGLLLLIGKENKNRRFWEKLDKEYLFEILFGIATDSNDILGIITKTIKKTNVSEQKIKTVLTEIAKVKYQTPPIYSAVKVKAKPLYYWARKGLINKIKIPQRKIKIYKIKLESINLISQKKLQKNINARLNLIKGDFRQKQILTKWNNFFKSSDVDFYKTALIQVKCSSGTYVRSISRDIGKKLKIPTLTFTIKRTKIFLPKKLSNS
ncbi:hypothetical protein ACFLZ1_04770 [Patescibacteria group bacterium]